ncbi:carboxypeptidase B-like [Anopheles ziemanni]|uniref:carboxypeptidase B-like n=1 Tax=Anopheles coustani TaxID=139045 RepID=UPI002659367F|nr:carboxypeptidase B-like [Anopheles coustani]XP_058169888.1 carboxypeptidase B-like [Anopheles ziemanni]
MKFCAVFALVALALLSQGGATERVSYRNYKVYSIQVDSVEKHNILKRWEDRKGVDFWDRAGYRVMIHPTLQDAFERFLSANRFTYERIIEDVEATIEAERQYDQEYRRRKDATGRATVDFEHFWTNAEVNDYLDELARTYPSLVSVETIGSTHLGNPIKSISISTNGGVAGSKPVVFIDGGLHAREWAGVMSVLYLIHELVEHSSDYADLLNKDWVIVPVANPDGYGFSHTDNRMWRKNRFPATILCTGIDLNRNWAYQFVASTNACSDSYTGTAAFSELETQALAHSMRRYGSNIALYLAVHTYGDMILYPYGYAWPFVPVTNQAAHIALGEQARDAVTAVGGPRYVVGNSAEILYTANGCSDDYAAAVVGAQFAYTLELTGGGSQGFDLPASQILAVATQTFEIFRTMANNV